LFKKMKRNQRDPAMTAKPPHRPPHAPSHAERQLVQLHSTIGTPQDVIAQLIGIDTKTLRKHYRAELDLATAQANAAIGGALFNKAKGGDTTAMIFWMKTRARWSENAPPNAEDNPAPRVEFEVKPAQGYVRVTKPQ
jgi:hypothetical protein